jgi:PAS domain S-box-containing protein
VTTTPNFNDELQFSGMFGVIRDVTERLRTEEMLAQDPNLLRTLIDNMPDLIFVKDTESRFVISNLALEQFLGAKTPDEMIGQTDFDFFPQELAAQYYAGEQALLRSGQPLLDQEVPSVDHAGSRRWHSTSKVPLRDSRGKIIGLVGISRDITERKQAQELLRLTQFTVDHAAIDITWVGPDARFYYLNEAACRNLGYSRQEMLSMTVHDIQADPASPEMWPAHWQELKQRGSFSFETQHRHKNGEIIPVEVTVHYIAFSGQEYNCAFWRNITERKQLEQRSRESLEHRTRQVQTSTEIAQEIASAMALDDIFQRVVDLVQKRIGYPHIDLYMVQDDFLVLQEGSGVAGRQMKEAGHKIALRSEKSLVARAGRSGEPVLALDVSQESDGVPHTFRPETRAKIVVPIKFGAEVLGVLDVQSENVAGINEEDQLLLLGLGGQIAVAIENVRLYEAVRLELAERQRTEDRLVEGRQQAKEELRLRVEFDKLIERN